VTHQVGVNVAEATQLRQQVRNAGAIFRVTKNRLAKRALSGTPFELLIPLFRGPTAIAFSRDPVAAPKVVVQYANRNDKLTIIGGGLAGRQMDAAGIRELASLPSLNELRGKLIGLLQAPAGRIARVLQAPAGQVARVFAAYAEKQGEGASEAA
jgi:large subunit ribosomal protein L10